MKKIYVLFCLLVAASASYAQPISNPGMETWRTSSSGSGPVVTTYSPNDWYSFDSLAINAEEMYVPTLLYPGYTPTDLHAQLFQETTIKHNGTSSAKLVSVKQDTLGIFAGSMANAQPSLDLAAASGGDIAHAIDYSGGTAITQHVATVSAWVEYFPGKDATTGAFGGVDTGTLTAQAICVIAGIDSVVGSGVASVTSASSFTQITATLNYTDNVNTATILRIIFSSGATTGGLDSSIMYVDDVTMAGWPLSVANTHINNLVKVYPNPTSGIIHFDGPQNTALTCQLTSVTGQVVATKNISGSDMLDVSYLPAGSYFYTFSDVKGNKVQSGKVTVSK